MNHSKRGCLRRAAVLTLNSPAALSLRRPPSEAVGGPSKQNLTDGDARWKIPECWRGRMGKFLRKMFALNSRACSTRPNASVSEGWEQRGLTCPPRNPSAQVSSTLRPRKSMMNAEVILNVQHLASFVIAVAARLGLAGWARLKQPCSGFGGRSHLVGPRPSPAHTCRMCECCALTRWDQHRHVARGQPRPSGHLIRRRWVARSVPPRGTVTEPSSIGRGMGPRRRSSPRGVVAAHG